MAGRPGTLPWNMATFTGANPVTTLSDNFNFLNAQINDSGAGFTTFATDTGTPNNLITTLSAAPVAYEAGMMMCVVPANTNTGPSVINVNSLGNQTIVNPAGIALNGGELSQGFTTTLVYDGTNFRIVGSCSLGLILSSLTAPVIVNCAGYSSVGLRLAWTSGSSQNVLLNKLGQGVPVFISVLNSTGSSMSFFIFVQNAATGVVSTVFAYSAGTANGVAGADMRVSGVSINSSSVMTFTGSLVSPTQMYFSK